MLTTWSYYKRWGRDARGEPIKVIAVERRSAQGKHQVGRHGRWTTISHPWTPLDADTMYDLIPETEGLALARSLTSPAA